MDNTDKKKNELLGVEYYILYIFLYGIPVVGFVLAMYNAKKEESILKRNFAKSFYIYHIFGIIFFIIAFRCISTDIFRKKYPKAHERYKGNVINYLKNENKSKYPMEGQQIEQNIAEMLIESAKKDEVTVEGEWSDINCYLIYTYDYNTGRITTMKFVDEGMVRRKKFENSIKRIFIPDWVID